MCSYIAKGSFISFSIFTIARVQEYTGGGGKSSCTLSKMLVLATVPIHETS